jgi:hypothetical protein
MSQQPARIVCFSTIRLDGAMTRLERRIRIALWASSGCAQHYNAPLYRYTSANLAMALFGPSWSDLAGHVFRVSLPVSGEGFTQHEKRRARRLVALIPRAHAIADRVIAESDEADA